MLLGFPVRIHGRADLPSHDGRPAHQGPQLGLSLAYLRDILVYLGTARIGMYRMHAGLVPGTFHRTWADLADEISACAPQLALIGEAAHAAGIRLSIHAPAAMALNALDEDHVMLCESYLRAQAALLDAMALGPEAVVVVHVGGVYDDLGRARERFVSRYEGLAPAVRKRLVLENDDRRFAFGDLEWVHKRCGIPLVLDIQHHAVANPQRIPLRSALQYCLQTWPTGVAPKIHYSTPRTEMRSLPSGLYKAPTWTEHSDYVNPFEFASFMKEMAGLPDFDVMLEAKARDLALLKLREDLARFEPKLAARLA